MSRADTREVKSRLEALRRAGWTVTALKYGDYDGQDAVGKLWCIEHKTISKMVADMGSGILIRQCRSLIENCDFPILMVEGHWIQDADGYLVGSRITWEQAWDQLQTIQDMGCRLQLTTSPSHTLDRLFELESYYKKEKHDSVLRQTSGNPFVVALSLIDGVNEGKAKAIESCYPTLLEVSQLRPEELYEVNGIGAVLGRRIWQFFRRNWRVG